MLVRFWGTRGSIPTPGQGTAHFGGNTSCVELRADDGTLIILDAGTGARELGLHLLRQRPVKAHILITHTHWDHIQGFPFFTPAFLPDSEITVYAPTGFTLNLSHALSGQMQYSYFPVKLDELRSQLDLLDVEEGSFQIGDVRVETQYLNHTCPTIGYRITAGGATVVYSTDHEPYTMPSGTLVHPGDHRHISFLDRADLVIHDSQYSEDEYPSKLGWGHSTVNYATEVAMEAGAKRLALFHHDPTHDDSVIERLEANSQAHALTRRSGMEVFAASEGMELYLPEQAGPALPAAERSALDRRPVTGARVLVVSDNPVHTTPVAEVLQHEGMETIVAENEAKARDLAHRAHPHAVVLDAGSLGPRTYALAASLSADFHTLDMAIVLLAPSLDDETIRRAHAAGITDCLAIPFSAPMLYARLKAWITRYYRPDRRRRSVAVRIRARAAKTQPLPAPANSSTDRKAEILSATPLFGSLPEPEMAALARRARHRVFNPGASIAEQGNGGGTLYVIVSGRVRVVGRPPEIQAGEVLLDELGPGEIFGELSTLDDLPHSATVKAVIKTRCLVINRGDILSVMERNPAFNLRLLRTLTHRLRQADRLLVRSGPDALTGLSTRQTVEEHYKREAAATRRRRYVLGILLVDIDELDSINDAYGHVVGDEALRALADALRSSTRESDIVGRLGGDNFAVILPDAGIDGGRLVAARITRTLEGLVSHRSLPGGVSCSIRMASSPNPPATLDEWLLDVEQSNELWRQRASG